jgi:hypothetical protein
MPKQKIQDIIAKNKKADKDYSFDNLRAQKIIRRKTKIKFPSGKMVFGILLFVLALILGTKILDAFSKAVIHVTLYQETINIDTILKASQESSADLTFETVEMQITEEKTMAATGVKTVETKARGKIIVYNSYGSKPQTLIKNTRFETPDGKIYSINERIIVPGAKVENGKIVPSSIEVTVYADMPGEEYNMGLTDFTIPGFKGGPRYEKFYARSKTAMDGGFKGEIPVVSKEDSQKLKESVENSITNKLLKNVLLQKPEGYLLYKDAIKITFTESEQKDPKTTRQGPLKFTVKETGMLFAYLFSEKALSNALVKKYLGEEFQNKVRAGNIENLKFELINQDIDKGTVVFKLKGKANFVWLIDEEKLKEALIASSENFESVFKSYPAIEHASIVFRPSWWKFFPDKKSKISIEQISQ